jgi:hypothetical protein
MPPARDQERRARLEAELVAIDKWDELYRQEKTHHTRDEFSYQARQLRRQQIMREIEADVKQSRNLLRTASQHEKSEVKPRDLS